MRWSIVAAVFACTLVGLAVGQNEPLGQMKIVRLRNGTNAVDLDGNRRADLVVVAWRENYNAHGYDLFTFYVQDSTVRERALNLVVFTDSLGAQTADAFRTDNGADCVVSDVRVLQPKAGPDLVVIGTRDFGESYADSLPVTFTVYRLSISDEGVIGVPPFQFKAVRTLRSRARYCDVNDAFRAELGLGWYR
jgi:hypothetical protein